MLDFILQVLSGSSPVIGLAANLFWPFVSIQDLITISGLLVGAALVELWTKKCRGKRVANSKYFREDA